MVHHDGRHIVCAGRGPGSGRNWGLRGKSKIVSDMKPAWIGNRRIRSEDRGPKRPVAQVPARQFPERIAGLHANRFGGSGRNRLPRRRNRLGWIHRLRRGGWIHRTNGQWSNWSRGRKNSRRHRRRRGTVRASRRRRMDRLDCEAVRFRLRRGRIQSGLRWLRGSHKIFRSDDARRNFWSGRKIRT